MGTNSFFPFLVRNIGNYLNTSNLIKANKFFCPIIIDFNRNKWKNILNRSVIYENKVNKIADDNSLQCKVSLNLVV